MVRSMGTTQIRVRGAAKVMAAENFAKNEVRNGMAGGLKMGRRILTSICKPGFG